MKIEMEPIGYVRTAARELPRHWTVSDVEGEIEIDERYREGLADVEPGRPLVVLFCFPRSPPFEPSRLRQTPPHRAAPRGVFSTCSPVRPNPIGMSIVDVLEVRGCTLRVARIDMRDGTPVLDLKPCVRNLEECPSAP